ncbi:hypothetical protein BDZ91DRAFT_764006 [Kalaharituber pfeilii]|nr:hypothetical protein BDZ91DRAFT_764006 [Kalaharituber pfeilii]
MVATFIPPTFPNSSNHYMERALLLSELREGFLHSLNQYERYSRVPEEGDGQHGVLSQLMVKVLDFPEDESDVQWRGGELKEFSIANIIGRDEQSSKEINEVEAFEAEADLGRGVNHDKGVKGDIFCDADEQKKQMEMVHGVTYAGEAREVDGETNGKGEYREEHTCCYALVRPPELEHRSVNLMMEEGSIQAERKRILRALENLYALQLVILEELYIVLDRAVWHMMDVVNMVEKSSPISTRPRSATTGLEMHSIAKHILHLSESSQAMLETVKAMRQYHEGANHGSQFSEE